MTHYDTRINILKKNIFKSRFTAELDYLNKSDTGITIDNSERENQLKIILSQIDENNKEKIVVKQKNELDLYLDKINQNAYKKQWNSLTKFHKSVKLKEFSESLTDNKKLRDEIYSKLINALNDKKIHTSKSISYDLKTEKIIEIKGFTYDSKKNTYSCKF